MLWIFGWEFVLFQSVAGFHHQRPPHLAGGVMIIGMMGEAVLSIQWKIAWKEAAHCSITWQLLPS